MALRADPLAGAAEAVAAIERRCGGGRYSDSLQDAGTCCLLAQVSRLGLELGLKVMLVLRLRSGNGCAETLAPTITHEALAR